ncbi:hypothetical protein BSKO_02271 [Bryopsis sp. KO-2023]|nr:hypothetical protein BSKO_02271 [Bryopsis sp. KO-2023]
MVNDKGLWNPWSLQFENQAWEKQFSGQAKAISARNDVIGVVMGWLGVLGCLNETKMYIGFHHRTILSIVGFVIYPLLGFLWWKQRGSYSRSRKPLLFTARILIPLHSAWLLFEMNKPMNPTMKEVFGRIFLESPISMLVGMTFWHSLPFKSMFFQHSFSLVLSSPWMLGFCRTCSETPLASGQIKVIGDVFDTVSTLVFNAVGLPIVRMSEWYTCLGVSAYAHVSLGWLVPLFLTYQVELSSRGRFLRSVVHSREQRSVDEAQSTYRHHSFQVFGFMVVILWPLIVFLAPLCSG